MRNLHESNRQQKSNELALKRNKFSMADKADLVDVAGDRVYIDKFKIESLKAVQRKR